MENAQSFNNILRKFRVTKKHFSSNIENNVLSHKYVYLKGKLFLRLKFVICYNVKQRNVNN